jgi:acetyl esterase
MPAFHPTDPTVSGIDPAVLRAQRRINALLTEVPLIDPADPHGLAALRAKGPPPAGHLGLAPEDVIISVPGGQLRVQVVGPEGAAAGVLVRMHGGGFATGSPEDDLAVNARLAQDCGIAIVSPEYRLAPEVSIPDQVEDCVAVAVWADRESAPRFGTSTLLVGGISAGACLAASMLLRLRDREHPAFTRVAGVLLDCGPFDLSMTPSARASTDSTPSLPRSLVFGMIGLAVHGIDMEARRDPTLSPLYADLRGLPPALFTVGALDPFLDDTRFMAGRWQSAGGKVDLDVWPEGAHAFTNMTTPLAELALRRTAAWIDSVLDGAASKGP